MHQMNYATTQVAKRRKWNNENMNVGQLIQDEILVVYRRPNQVMWQKSRNQT